MNIKNILKEYTQQSEINYEDKLDYESLRYENVQKGDILVIHPDDRSTDFLKPSYEGLGATVITQRNQMFNLQETVENHNRIIMMGHGAPSGLFMPKIQGVELGVNNEWVPYETYSIDNVFADILKNKSIAAIWCNADGYVVPHDLHGFYTGMAISELCEADYCGVGERVAQGVISSRVGAEFGTLMEVDKLSETNRGSGGFGSTGTK